MNDPFDAPPPAVDPFDLPPPGGDLESQQAAVMSRGAGGNALPNTLEAIKGSALTLRHKLFPPGNPLAAMTLGKYGGDNSGPEIAQREADVAAYKKRLPELGLSGQVGDAIPKMLLEGAALTPAATFLRGGLAAAGAGPRLAGLGGDIAAYGGYGGGAPAIEAAAEASKKGKSAWEAAKEGVKNIDLMGATLGAAGGALGHSLGAMAENGIAPLMSRHARTLLENEITPTWGQAAGRAASKAEEGLAFSPVGGSAISNARDKSISQFTRADVNEKLRPLNLRTEHTGDRAVAEGRKLVSDTYDTRLQDVQMTERGAQQVLNSLPGDLARAHPLVMSDGGGAIVLDWAKRNIGNFVTPNRTGAPVSGRIWKDLYSEMGTRAANAGSRSEADAWRVLQDQWLGRLDERVAGARDRVREVDEAFRGLIPAERARRGSVDDLGDYTPGKVVRAANAQNIPETALQQAGRQVLPRTLSTPWRIGRGASNYAGAASIGYGTSGSSLIPEAASHVIYSEALRKFLMGQYHLPVSSRQIGAAAGGLGAPEVNRLYQGEQNAP